MKKLHMLTFLLVLIGALNWGLIGLFNVNIVSLLLGTIPMLEKTVYILVGASALYEIFTHKDLCKMCKDMMGK